MTQSHLSDIPETIPAAFEKICRTATDRIAMQMKVEMHYQRYTYTEMAQQVQSFAIALIQQGIHPGSRVAIVSENRPEWVITYLGIVTAGGTAVPLDIQMTKKEILSLLEQSESQMVVASDQTRELVRTLPPTTRLITLDSRTGKEELIYEELLTQGLKGSMTPVPIHPEDVASLLYTSGTTGKPKGVLLTHRNLLSNARAMMNSGLGSGDDNFLLMLPLHHAYPFMIACLVPLLMGAKVTLLQSLKGPDLVQCVQETQITMLVGVPQVFAMIRRAVFDQISRKAPFIRMLVSAFLVVSGFFRRRTGWNLGRVFFKEIHQRFGGSLRLLCSGGAKLEPEVASDFERLGFTILQGYGLTETSPVITFTPLEKPKLPSVGVPLPGVTVRIANPDEGGIGELLVRGPNVMAGYDHHPEATGEAIRDGWFYTGDLGYLDQEGYLFLTGRSKELIVTAGGKNIYPEELEKEYQSSPAIAEICLMSGDLIEKGREGIHAIILPDFDFLKTQKLLDVPQHLKYELTRIGMTMPPYKRVTGISLVKEPLPRTRLGKIKRHKVLALLETEPEHEEEKLVTSVMEQEVLATETARRVVTTLTTLLPKTKLIRLDDHLDLDLGLDSLRRVELLASLEQQFGRLPDSMATEVITVKDLIEKINESVKEPTEETIQGLQSWENLLVAPPPSKLTTRLLQTPSVWQRSVESATRGILWMICRLAFRLEVKGLDHLPRQGPFVLASNHVSYVDPFVILISVPPAVFHRIFTLGWEPYFRGWIGRFFAWIGHVIPIGPDTSLVTVLQTSATGLRQGKSLLIFPEGERSIDGRLLEFRKGIGILACELTVPIVPAWIEGTYKVLPVGARWPRLHHVAFQIGEPFSITHDQIEGWKKEGVDPYEAATRLIQKQVLDLAN
ncbi:MAG: AMP-binding protein [Nitrospirota bacterium]|nr:MAG: AMP-binding protein [Nitrospirota bacterium]